VFWLFVIEWFDTLMTSYRKKNWWFFNQLPTNDVNRWNIKIKYIYGTMFFGNWNMDWLSISLKISLH
jgi:hypothetical protein